MSEEMIYVALNNDENVQCEFVADRKPIFTQGSTKYYARADLAPSPSVRELVEALKDFSEIAMRAKPNCGPKLRSLIQFAQEKHREVLSNV